MSFQKHTLRRGIDVFTNIGAHDHTKELLFEHAKYCGAAIYMPPTQTLEIQACIQYLEMLRDYAAEFTKLSSQKFYPYFAYPITPQNAIDKFKLRESLEKGKANGMAAVVCRLREWEPAIYVTMAEQQARNERFNSLFPKATDRLHAALDLVQQMQIPVLLDASFPLNNQDPLAQWEKNGAKALGPIFQLFPALRCVVLHITTREMCDVIIELSSPTGEGLLATQQEVYAAITPHHLFMCDLGIGLRAYPEHPMPMPFPQTKADRARLQEVVGQSKKRMRNFVFSTDSACMFRGCVCGGWCGAVNSIPHAISLMLEGFEHYPLEPELDGFMLKNPGRLFTGIKAPDGNFEVESETVSNPLQNRPLSSFLGERLSFTGIRSIWHLK